MDFFSAIASSVPAQFVLAAGVLAALYRLAFGWLVPNLTLSVKIRRETLDRKHDHLALTVQVNKGSREGLRITHLAARISPIEANTPDITQSVICPLHGCDRFQDEIDGQVNWNRTDAVPMMIAPDELMELAGYARVQAGSVYLIEVICLVRHLPSLLAFNRHIQWRTSAISLPESQDSVTV